MHKQDIEALFRQWVQLYYNDVYRWCYRYTGNHHDAADVTQETFTNAFRHADTYRGEGAVRSWLLTVATRSFLRFFKRERRQQASSDVYRGGEAVHEESAEDVIVEQMEREALWRRVRALPVQERIAITLFYAEELSYAEIASTMGVTLPQVRNFIHRGKRHLQTLVERRDEHGQR